MVSGYPRRCGRARKTQRSPNPGGSPRETEGQNISCPVEEGQFKAPLACNGRLRRRGQALKQDGFSDVEQDSTTVLPATSRHDHFVVEKILKLFSLNVIDLDHFFPVPLQTKHFIGAIASPLGEHTLAFFRSVRQATICVLFLIFHIADLSAQEQAQADLAQLPTGELEKQAVFMVGGQKYVEAISLLTELVNRLGESKDAQMQSKVEGFRYFLGLGHVFNSDWEAAATAFESFLKSHPKSNRYRKALEFYGDTLSQTKRHAEAAEQYKKLLELKMTDLESLPIWEKLASCYMRDQKWSEAVPVLLTMLQKSRTEAQREQAVVWLAQSYIESNQGNKVIELLPDMLTKAPKARLSIDFNLALLNGGDKMFAAKQDVLALLVLQSGASTGALA